jgi:hypothetical protein
MEEHGAERARDVISRCIDLSKDGEIGKALDLLDDFLADTIPQNGGDWIERASGIPRFWLRRWETLGGSGNTPSYVSRIFLVLLLRCITLHRPLGVTSPIFGIEELWKVAPCSSDDQFVVKTPVLVHSNETMPDLTVLQEQPAHELAESWLEARLGNQSGMISDGVEATNIQQ